MGLLSQGSLLSWEETQHHVDHMRRHGILQFLHIYHAVKEWHKDVLKWGNEVSTLFGHNSTADLIVPYLGAKYVTAKVDFPVSVGS